MPRDMQRSLGDGGMPLLTQLGLTFDATVEGSVDATWVPTDLACNPLGGVHGGVFGVIHDAAMNFAVNSGLESGDRAATLDISYQTMRPAVAGDVLSVHGELLRATKQIAYATSAVRNAQGAEVSLATATFLLRRRT